MIIIIPNKDEISIRTFFEGFGIRPNWENFNKLFQANQKHYEFLPMSSSGNLQKIKVKKGHYLRAAVKDLIQDYLKFLNPKPGSIVRVKLENVLNNFSEYQFKYERMNLTYFTKEIVDEQENKDIVEAIKYLKNKVGDEYLEEVVEKNLSGINALIREEKSIREIIIGRYIMEEANCNEKVKKKTLEILSRDTNTLNKYIENSDLDNKIKEYIKKDNKVLEYIFLNLQSINC